MTNFLSHNHTLTARCATCYCRNSEMPAAGAFSLQRNVELSMKRRSQMSKSALALAAAVLAATTLSNAANAGGIRLGFGFPLGSFVAKPFQDSSRDVSRSYQKNAGHARLCRPPPAESVRSQSSRCQYSGTPQDFEAGPRKGRDQGRHRCNAGRNRDDAGSQKGHHREAGRNRSASAQNDRQG